MPDLMSVAPWVFAVLTSIGAILAWTAKLRWSEEYRGVVDQTLKAKDAQISALQETLRAKDANAEMYKALSYAEALKQLNAQKDLFEQRVADYQQKVAGHEAKLEDLACQLDVKAREVIQAEAESRSLRMLVEQSATLTRQAAASASDYRAAVYALNARSDGEAVILRGGLQAMEEANRIAERNRTNSPNVQFHIPQILPDTTAPANLDYEVR